MSFTALCPDAPEAVTPAQRPAVAPRQPRDHSLHPMWPEIEGIDTQDARSRWCNDLTLFRSVLERWIDDFSDIACPPSDSQAARLHKLRGGACMLGAKTIQHVAAQAEAACVAGDVAMARQRTTQLVTLLLLLRADAAQSFARAEPQLS